MLFSTPTRKSVIALSLTLPLALAACGNSDEAEDDLAMTSTTTTTKPASSTATTEQSPTEEKPSEAPAPESSPVAPPPAPAPDQQPPAETIVNPLENGLPTVEPLPPVEGGPADEAVQGQIRELVNGIYAQQDWRAFASYVPQHTCQTLLDQQADELKKVDFNTIPQIPMTQMAPNWNQIKVQDIKDARINGDVASALITVDNGNGPESSTMRFKNEGGRWTFCNA